MVTRSSKPSNDFHASRYSPAQPARGAALICGTDCDYRQSCGTSHLPTAIGIGETRSTDLNQHAT
ncbi:hypothetical protein DSM100238_0219 [Bifidobacterium apri]|uniref:Uncharacterized protein n=1 Tax=Bifidobacterium apri TaxID=1769423 RepID=A0A6A2VGY1_9BIFI|nr:hypothetical protein DSM100238_0219 [Bifidobacterium apri]